MAFPTPYCYEPISSSTLRLLEIDASSEDVVCSLSCFPMDHPPEYYALSYVWGKEKPTASIICNGARLALSPHLLTGLRALKLVKQTHYWIDAICLNQQDEEEKAIHVPQMSQIYSSASRVIIRLGPASDGAVTDGKHDSQTIEAPYKLIPAALRLLKQWLTVPEPPCFSLGPEDAHLALDGIGQLNDHFENTKDWALLEADTLKSHGFPELHDSVWPAVLHLFLRDWFSRLWVLQEAVLAKEIDVLYGHTIIHWAAIVKFVVDVKLMVTGMTHDGHVYPRHQAIADYHSFVSDIFGATVRSGQEPMIDSSSTRYFAAIQSAWQCSCFFSTRNGCFGIGPDFLRKSDSICVFFTANTPHILRRRTEVKSFEFVGQAYVDGLMDGTVFNEEIEKVGSHQSFSVE
ncbi:hypothetical protein BU16DRAFT_621632 [Lophium mytilinum]|uniref:Heterokaryon incompatibility domain-containing protein n=1 Tax=Lophium mytilinum TaxID=390894 RepID=A0A6A6QH46_9PEZI|nr:hypothetical protein BU16DRAFT_621632 [Lophium mytilinum]